MPRLRRRSPLARRDSGSGANGNLAREWRSALFLPLDAGTDTVGVLSLFGHDAYIFGSAQQAEATRFSREASGALNLAVRREHDLEITGQLREPLVSPDGDRPGHRDQHGSESLRRRRGVRHSSSRLTEPQRLAPRRVRRDRHGGEP